MEGPESYSLKTYATGLVNQLDKVFVAFGSFEIL